MILVHELTAYCDQLLEPGKFRDYCPNGLQIEGRAEINVIVSGVTASMALIEAAIEREADALLVHHGYFWRGEPEPLVGMKQRRIKRLLAHDINLLAYHLPLDAHPELGNNACLARRLDFEVEGPLNRENIGLYGRLRRPMTPSELTAVIEQRLGRRPLHIASGEDERVIETIAWCTGGAQRSIQQAADLGVDAYLSGEISESTVHVARECGIDYFAAGHHATERGGVEALGDHLANQFGLRHEFVDIWNPA